VANTLAYYDMATITAVKSFIVQAPGKEIQPLVPIEIKMAKNIQNNSLTANTYMLSKISSLTQFQK
jgi:hypothetical protein